MSEAAATGPADPNDIRPVVRTARPTNLSLWLFGGALLLGGLLLFNALNSRRQEMIAPTTLPAGQGGGMITAPPPLALPQGYIEPRLDDLGRLVRRVRFPAAVGVASVGPPVVTRVVERQVPTPVAPASIVQPLPGPPVPVVIDRSTLGDRPSVVPGAAESDRVTAGRLLNPSLTVPQGTIIAAVLETAIDSTRAGAVRAIVSRDVRSFDGSRMLIPRGSRLYGEYASDLSAGQKRALVNWQRLTRPDAVIIDLDSPAADPLGRAGIRGKVESNFLARFGGAILQSVLDIGVGLATRTVADGTVIVGLPGSTQQITGQQQARPDVQRTVKVQQGTSVSVFVARDLDFSTVDR